MAAIGHAGERRGDGEVALRRTEVGPTVMDQPMGVDERDRVEDPLGRDPVLGHGAPQEPADPDAGRARAGDHDARLGERAARRPQRREHAGDDDRGRALDVVVERWDL